MSKRRPFAAEKSPIDQLWRTPADQRAYDEARRQVRSVRGFYRHAILFVVINLMLIAINLMSHSSRIWFGWPLTGWGSGLAVHGLLIWTRVGLLGPRWEERKIAELMARDKVRTLSTEKQLVEAQMRLLQAQIEPHFLFNTLANVVSLIETSPSRATLMLEHFIDYLRATLNASRSSQGTVAQEAALLNDYLEVIKIRMGERLRYSIDIDPTLVRAPLAPMLLQPVVENAIKHGLEPKIEGGQVTIRIRRVGNRLLASVEDDGLGFDPAARRRSSGGAEGGRGAGVGLENLRERLAVLYDGAAQVRIEERSPGTAVLIDLPLPELT